MYIPWNDRPWRDRQFLKGRFQYEIINQKSFDRYFIGKRPSTKHAFEWVIEEPGRTFIEASQKFDLTTATLYFHTKKLKELKIINKGRLKK